MRRTLIALTAALTLLATTAFSGGLGEMTSAERAAFRDEVKQYLMENPEVITEAMQVLQGRQDQAEARQDQIILSQNTVAIFNDPASWVGGNPNGDITIIEFMDYRCPYCRKAFSEVDDLVKTDGNIRLVVKELPILGEDSINSSRFAIAIRILHGDSAYKRAYDALITLKGSPDSETLARLAQDLGFEPKPVMDLMPDPKITAIFAANHALAEKLNISGTPTFVIDHNMLRGYVPEAEMRKIVAEQRAG